MSSGVLTSAIARRELALAQILDERAKQRPALGVPEHGAHGLVLEMEQIHLPAEPAVVASLGFLEAIEIRFELPLVRPGRAVDALEHLVARVAAPIRARELGELEPEAEAPRGRQVGAAAKIDEAALTVQADGLVRRDRADDLGLVLLPLAAKELDRGVTLPDLADDRLVAGDDLAHARLDALEVLGRKGFLAGEIVVEPVLDRRTDRDLSCGI